MIEVEIEEFKANVFEAAFKCPHCNVKLTCFYHIGEYCEFCFGKLPNIITLFDRGGGRMWYHKTGRTLDTTERLDKVLFRNIGRC